MVELFTDWKNDPGHHHGTNYWTQREFSKLEWHWVSERRKNICTILKVFISVETSYSIVLEISKYFTVLHGQHLHVYWNDPKRIRRGFDKEERKQDLRTSAGLLGILSFLQLSPILPLSLSLPPLSLYSPTTISFSHAWWPLCMLLIIHDESSTLEHPLIRHPPGHAHTHTHHDKKTHTHTLTSPLCVGQTRCAWMMTALSWTINGPVSLIQLCIVML